MNPPLEPVIVNFNFISSGPCDTGEKKKKEDGVYSCSFRAQSRARVCVCITCLSALRKARLACLVKFLSFENPIWNSRTRANVFEEGWS